jgi:hypothetical protein
MSCKGSYYFSCISTNVTYDVIRFALGLGLECKIGKIYFGLLCSGVNIVINFEIICDS